MTEHVGKHVEIIWETGKLPKKLPQLIEYPLVEDGGNMCLNNASEVRGHIRFHLRKLNHKNLKRE